MIARAGHTVVGPLTVVPGGGQPVLAHATVVTDDQGVVQAIEADRVTDAAGEWLLLPAAVDLHLDNLGARLRPRATVALDPGDVVPALDAECAAAGIAVVCVAARCEEAPAKGAHARDAVRLAEVVEILAPALACDWWLHARVEVTDPAAVDTLHAVLARSSRVALVSVMDHSAERTRFTSVEEHRRFYAADWGVGLDEVDALLSRQRAGAAADERRREVARLVTQRGLPLASHDDRTAEQVEEAAGLGACIAEFPLTLAAAQRAQELGMRTVLGAPNAVRGRSTSPGNLLVAEAVEAGVCDALCSDYLPSALARAPHALAEAGVMPLASAVDLIARAPAAALGRHPAEITVGRPLTATLRHRVAGVDLGMALWRGGRLVWRREPCQPSHP